jgi:hypothetical protein
MRSRTRRCFWRRLLREWGLESEIVAEYVHPDLRGDAIRSIELGGGS